MLLLGPSWTGEQTSVSRACVRTSMGCLLQDKVSQSALMHTLAHSSPGLAPLHANRWVTHRRLFRKCSDLPALLYCAPHSAQEEGEKGKDLHAAAVHGC